MNRNQFIELFNMHFDNKKMYEHYREPLYEFNIDVLNFDDKESITKGINEHLIGFVNILNLKESSFIEKLNIKVSYDFDFEDDDEESEFCRYNCKLNINHFYDQFILFSHFTLSPITLYRLESEKNEGLYSTGFAATINCNDTQQSPYDDKLLKYVFDSDMYSKDEDYKIKWFFAFSNIKQIKEWLNNDDTILNQYSLHIKKLIIPNNFVIEGEKQTIFQKKHVVYEEIVDYKKLFNKNNKVILKN